MVKKYNISVFTILAYFDAYSTFKIHVNVVITAFKIKISIKRLKHPLLAKGEKKHHI